MVASRRAASDDHMHNILCRTSQMRCTQRSHRSCWSASVPPWSKPKCQSSNAPWQQVCLVVMAAAVPAASNEAAAVSRQEAIMMLWLLLLALDG